jgi:hypothetical protein
MFISNSNNQYKKCSTCKEIKLKTCFCNKKYTKDKLATQCRECMANYNSQLEVKTKRDKRLFFRRFTFATEELYENYLKCINCQCCGIAFSDFKSKDGNFKCLDHCHAQNSYRGIICHKCNITEGFITQGLHEDLNFIDLVIKYYTKYNIKNF